MKPGLLLTTVIKNTLRVKCLTFLIIIVMSVFIGLPAQAVESDIQAPSGTSLVVPEVNECNEITGANFQPAASGGAEIVSLDTGGLFEGVGLQVKDVILAVKPLSTGVFISTNDAVSFCKLIVDNKGKTVQLLVKDINSGNLVTIDVAIPS